MYDMIADIDGFARYAYRAHGVSFRWAAV